MLNSDHREKERCPCNQSIQSSWKLDCVKCGQFWHTDCVGLKGIDQKTINKLTHYLCPFCFVSPVPTLSTAVHVCHICRNTLSLQQTNIEYEVNSAQSKLKDICKCCSHLSNLDLEQFNKNIDIVSQLDTRLQHLLLNHHSLKNLEKQMTAVSELLLLTSTDLKLNPQGPELENISESIKSHDKSFESLHSNIRKLQEDLEALSKSSAPASSAEPTNAESTDKLLAEISSKLESICHEETGISAGLNELKQSITTVQSSARQSAIPPSMPPPTFPPQPQPPTNFQTHPEPQNHPHGQSPISEMITDFVSDDEAERLTQFLSTCSFKSERSHAVVSFGTPYDYNNNNII